MKHPNQPGKVGSDWTFRNGDTIRTDRYRFTEYTQAGGQVVARMLYDHGDDPDENVNVAEEQANAKTVEGLTKQLRSQMGKSSSKQSE